jgi:hypothetical protein
MGPNIWNCFKFPFIAVLKRVENPLKGAIHSYPIETYDAFITTEQATLRRLEKDKRIPLNKTQFSSKRGL